MTYFSRIVFFALSLNLAAFGGQGSTCPASFSLDPLLNELGTEVACSEICDFVIGIQKELGLENHCIEVRKFSPQAIKKERTFAMVMGQHHLFVNETFFFSLTVEERRFLIGHELIHIRYTHPDKTLAGAALSGGVTMAVGMQAVYVLEKLCPFITSLCPFLYTASVAAGAYASMYMYGVFSRYHEKEADTCAAKELNCAQGGIAYFKRNVVADSKVKTLDPLALYKKAFDEMIRTHPERIERVTYLQKLVQAAPAA